MDSMGREEIRQRVQRAVRTMPARNSIRRIALFGSHLHGDQQAKSDVDLLVEFARPVGYFTLASMERILSEAIGLPVDLVTPKSLSKYFRDDVLCEAEPLYEG